MTTEPVLQPGWITLDEAAALLGLERSGVFRKAKRGDFGPIQEIGGKARSSIILVNAAAITEAAAHLRRPYRQNDQAAHLERIANALETIADVLETIAACLTRVSSHQAIRVDKLL